MKPDFSAPRSCVSIDDDSRTILGLARLQARRVRHCILYLRMALSGDSTAVPALALLLWALCYSSDERLGRPDEQEPDEQPPGDYEALRG